ncbi:uncharacterized protein [Apostichopus japonicus]|uniref:uncharacterized protein n=1 Tax=Stichopus japonicus TaxID=307972 RepID=UPI003AB8E091
MAESIRTSCTRCLKKYPRYLLSMQTSCDHLLCSKCSTEILHISFSCPKCRPLITLPGPATDGTHQPLCLDHNSNAEFYCYSCQAFVCSKCLLKTHKIPDHEVAVLDDDTTRKVKANLLETLNQFQREIADIAQSIAHAKRVCKEDKERLAETISTNQKQAAAIIQCLNENLLDELQRKFQETSDIFTLIDRQCKKAEEETSNTLESIKADKSADLAQIKCKFEDIKAKCHQLKQVKIPSNLNLKFEDELQAIAFGNLVPSRADNEDSSGYTRLMTPLPKWILKDTTDIKGCELDFANMICINEDWIVHLSNLYGSLCISVKHFSIKQASEFRQPFILPMPSYNWTVARTAGHDRSILIASCRTVTLISFRREDMEVKHTLEVSIDVEAISWDEYGIDCYLLAKNLRDIHWLSRNGELKFLCTLGTALDSPGSMQVYNQTTLAFLDISSREVYSRDFITNVKGTKTLLKQPLPREWKLKTDTFVPRAVVCMPSPGYHLVLFHGGDCVAVGQYDENFRFLGWIVTVKSPSEEDFMDIAVQGDKIFLLFETKLLVYGKQQSTRK